MLWLKLVYSDVNNILFFLVGSFPPSQPGKMFLKRDAAALKAGERAFRGHHKKWEEMLPLCLGSISVIPWQLSDDVIWGVSSVKVDMLVTQLCLTVCNPTRLLWTWNLQNTGVSCHSILQGTFPTQGLNLDLLPCRQILYHLSHLGSQTLLEPESNNLPVVVTVYLLTHVHPFATLWTAAHQASLSFIISWNLLKLILSWWCYPTISSSVALFFSCL